MQIHTFYPAYLNDFYSKNPLLAGRPYETQITALINDGFSGSHLFTPYMGPFGYETMLVIANCETLQTQWARENIAPLSGQPVGASYELVVKQVEHFKPDILYLTDPITFDSRFVRSLSFRPSFVFGWRAASIPSDTDWSEFDLIVSNDAISLGMAQKLGARNKQFFMPGFPTNVAKRVADERKQHDVVFSGQVSGEHTRRRQILNDISVLFSNARPFSLAYFIPGAMEHLEAGIAMRNQGAVWGMDMYRSLKRGRIALNVQIDIGGNQAGNMRLFETTGVGAFLLTDFHPNIKDYFEPGAEIETYASTGELNEKLLYYLDNPEKREMIARLGQERCLREYSMEKRAAELDRIIRDHLVTKSGVGTKLQFNVVAMNNNAARLYNMDDTAGAFDLLVKIKGLRQPLQGVDLLRALCFHRMNQTEAALEAVREELRWFPENKEARQLLNELQKLLHHKPAVVTDDPDFLQVLALVRPYTMLSDQRLYSLYRLGRYVCEQNIQGNFVECGVAAGGSSALLAWVIKKYSNHPRKLFAFDSFSGMPQPTADDSHQGIAAEATGWGTGTCSAPEESVREVCARLGVAHILVTVKGYFEETLPSMTGWVGMIALLHMDGDWYESTKCILHNLYGQISNDALIQVDDYGYWDGCRKAIHEFEALRSVRFAINHIDGTGVWFAKPDRFPVNPAIPAYLIEEFQQDDPVPQGFTTQMSINERFQLYYTIRSLNLDPAKVFRFIEIGSYGGGSLLLVCLALKRMGAQFQGISVEPGGPSQFRHVLQLLGNSVIHIPMFSHEALQKLSFLFSATQPPGFILVDGDHTYQGVRQDIIDYYPLLAPGGTMLFHDYLPPLDAQNREFILAHHANTEPGIRQACHEVMEKEYGLTPVDIPLPYPTNPAQTQAHLPIIPGVYSTIRTYIKPI